MTDRVTGEGPRGGLFAALKGLVATSLAIGRTRAELLVTEIEEEKYRLIALWSRAIGAAFLLAIGLIMAMFSLALAFWEQRVFILGGFAFICIVGGLLLALQMRVQARQPSRLFQSSLAELDADIEQLRRRPSE